MIAIVDTGCANIASLRFALERLGASPIVSSDAKVLGDAERLFLPGVGTAGAAMASLRGGSLVEFLQGWKRPLLGICLGMQLLAEHSKESCEGATEGLAICEGDVQKLDSQGLALPHMGWNSVSPQGDHPLFEGIPAGTDFYFVHSFGIASGKQTIATCEYGTNFSAAIANGPSLGVQFHPERSGKAGAKLLANFLAWKGQA